MEYNIFDESRKEIDVLKMMKDLEKDMPFKKRVYCKIIGVYYKIC